MITYTLTHPDVQRLARLLLEARQARGIRLKNWMSASDAQRTALLMDAKFVLEHRGIALDRAA